MEPFYFENQSLKLMKADGSAVEVPIHGELKQDNVPEELLYPNTNIVRLIVPEGEISSYNWKVETDEIETFIDYANKVMSEIYPGQTASNYMEQGFTTRVFKMQDYMKVMNIAVDLAIVFAQCFVILLSLIGLTNVISTMSANVQMRSREFAVLQSIGMTMKGVKRMIIFESIICSARSLLIGFPIAIVLTYFINVPIRKMLPVPYQLPLAAVICCAVTIFAVTGGTMWLSSLRLQKKNIVETIRSEN